MSTIRYELYSHYERVWHWLQAGGILLLILTGVVIHVPDQLSFIPFQTAVTVHNVLGLILVLNAFLGLFYYVATGTIRQYLPEPHDFISLSFQQAMYYLRGMFRGEAHPLVKVPHHRLNPLQQVTYLIILNILLPLQVVTGLLMMGAQQWPETVSSIGGLGILAMIHTLGAWLFGAFIIMHAYLTTTGHTPLSNLKAMILGYEDIPDPAHARLSEEDGSGPLGEAVKGAVTEAASGAGGPA